jgi:hypothetical protein
MPQTRTGFIVENAKILKALDMLLRKLPQRNRKTAQMFHILVRTVSFDHLSKAIHRIQL